MRYLFLLILICTLNYCSKPGQSTKSILPQLSDLNSITGKTAYLASPFTVTGDQMYLVGHQDGSFPDLGWHVSGEMGGIWQHPIKLMDGFTISIQNKEGAIQCLDQATRFINYPIAGRQQFDLTDWNLQVDRVQFIPNGLGAMAVEVSIQNKNTQQAFEGALNFTGMIDLRPVWLGERTEMMDQKDSGSYDETLQAFVAKDQGNEWYALWGSSSSSTASKENTCLPAHQGQGIDLSRIFQLKIEPGAHQVLHFFLAGSSNNKEEAIVNYKKISNQLISLVENKKAQYQNIQQTARLYIPDTSIQEAFEWTKYASDWLRFEIPGKGTGIAAGIPDYPWWFGCDQTYSTRGLVTIGMSEFATEIMNTLLDLSETTNVNGKIVHEVSTNGAVFNDGNINETPHFIGAAWELFCWTGDEPFLKRAYQQAQKGLTWLEAQDQNRNGYPDGHGMMEIQGMDAEMMDVIAYTYEAYVAAAQMAKYFGDSTRMQTYNQQAALLKEKINTDWWVSQEASFADFRSNSAKALTLIEGAIVRADTLGKPWAVNDLKVTRDAIKKRPSKNIEAYGFYHNWVVNTPLETGAATPENALLALKTAEKYRNPFGVYVTGIDRKQVDTDPAAFAALKAKESFNYTGAVMTLPTGVQAIAAAKYGQTDQSLDYLQRMVRSFSYAAPGSMYEVSPDYGMLVQAWNVYALARPLISHFLGIQPEAFRKHIKIQPQLPSSWPEMRIENLPIGDNIITVKVETNSYSIQQSLDWSIELVLPVGINQINLNGKVQMINDHRILINGLSNQVSW